MSLCSYNVHYVTMQLQCTLCHYLTTGYTMSLCSQLYSVHYVTMYLQCTLCHYVTTVYTMSLCSKLYSVHYVTMQLHCTLCYYVPLLKMSIYLVVVTPKRVVIAYSKRCYFQTKLSENNSFWSYYNYLFLTVIYSYSVHCVTMQLQCTLCHYVRSYSVHCVTMQLQYTLCHYLTTVYTMSLCSYTVYTVSLCSYTVSLCS